MNEVPIDLMNNQPIYEILNEARKLSLDEVTAMEAHLEESDTGARIMILARLTGPHWKDDTLRARRTEHILWFARNAPDHPILAEAEGQIIFDEPAYSDAKNLLLEKLRCDSNNVQLVRNAAMWTLLEDDGTAEELLHKGERLEPTDQSWSLFLSTLYGIRAGRCTVKTEKKKWKQLEKQEKARNELMRKQRQASEMHTDNVPSKTPIVEWKVSNKIDFKIGTDKNATRNGVPSIYLKSVVPRPRQFGFMAKSIQPDNYRCKKLRVSAWIKTDLPDGASAQLWLRVDGNWKKRAECFDNMYKKRVKGVTEWQRCEVSVEVPTESINIVYGVLLNGTGTVWLDDIQLEAMESET